MASIPIQEDKDLFEKVFGEVVEQADLDHAEAQKLVGRLESLELDTVTAVAMWDDQSLLGGPAARPAVLARLRQDVMGAGTTPPPVDSNRLRNTIGLLAAPSEGGLSEGGPSAVLNVELKLSPQEWCGPIPPSSAARAARPGRCP